MSITFYATVEIRNKKITKVTNAWAVISNIPVGATYYELDFINSDAKIMNGNATITYNYRVKGYVGVNIKIFSTGIKISDVTCKSIMTFKPE